MGQGAGGTACAYGGDLFTGKFCLSWEFSLSLQISSHAQSILPDVSGNGSEASGVFRGLDSPTVHATPSSRSCVVLISRSHSKDVFSRTVLPYLCGAPSPALTTLSWLCSCPAVGV